MKNDIIISYVLEFAEKLVGTPRGTSCNLYKLNTNTSPFWASDEPLPTIDKLKKEGMVCSGLINIMRRKAGLTISVLDDNNKNILGGTRQWFNYLNNNNKLQLFDISNSYPKGTMLLRTYNLIDQGHLAVIYEEAKEGVLFSKLIHSVGWNDGSSEKYVKIDYSVGKSHFCQYNSDTNKGHYTHICLPENWLLN